VFIFEGGANSFNVVGSDWSKAGRATPLRQFVDGSNLNEGTKHTSLLGIVICFMHLV
jgi:hypothetical protein